MAGNLVEKYLKEWTEGLPPIPGAVQSIFCHIRDIPYTAIPGLSDPWTGPELLLSIGRGSCTPKHNLLGRMLSMLGIRVRYVSYRFSWNDEQISYPDQLRKQAERLPLVYHMAIKALLHNRWTLLDTTWDPPLQKAGFPVNVQWDGISDCLLAVVPVSFTDGSIEIIHDSIDERDEFYQHQATSYRIEDLLALNLFYEDLNSWLDSLRGDPCDHGIINH